MNLAKRGQTLAVLLAATMAAPALPAQAAPANRTLEQLELETGGVEEIIEPSTPLFEIEAPSDGSAEIVLSGNEEIAEESEIQTETQSETQTETQTETQSTETTALEVVISGNSAKPSTNEQLVEAQQIIEPPVAEEEFRFQTVKKTYAVTKRKRVYFMEEMDRKSRKVGVQKEKAVIYLLSEEKDGWYFAESGQVRGFVRARDIFLEERAKKMRKKSDIRRAEQAEALVEYWENKAFTYLYTTTESTLAEKNYAIARREMDILDSIPENGKYIKRSEQLKPSESEMTKEQEIRLENSDQTAEILVAESEPQMPGLENEPAAGQTTPVSEEPAMEQGNAILEKSDIEKMDAESEKSANLEDESENQEDITQVVGTLEEDGLCYILSETEDREWFFVESGSVRGFVKRKLLRRGNSAERIVMEKGEENMTVAKELIKPKENKACYYTLTSTRKASVADSIRNSMVAYAQQFIGNPYVWGGTSLTKGADCSGFVQSIYRDFGYSIPRVAEDQAQVGVKIPVESAQPGDLIFYARNGYIYHVVMSLGNNRTIEAQGRATGIVYNIVNYNNAVWAVRIISDEDAKVLDNLEKNTDAKAPESILAQQFHYGEKLGNFKLTAYCSCPKCCGVWSGGPTASGAMPVAGRTVAMAGVPFGTQLIINGQVYTVEDRGTPYGHVDIYMNNHDTALHFGVRYADVYSVK